jgi:hypothetical protein
MSDNPITIAIKGKVSYEDTITVAQAAQIITFLNASEEDSPTLGSSGADAQDERNSSAPTGRKPGNAVGSAREALDLSGAKTNPEKIVALGEYVLQDGGETFKVEDVKTQFRRARETAPANFSRDLSAAVQAGWIAQGDGDEYYITNRIQGIFDGNFEFPKTGSGGKTRSSTKSTKAKSEKPEVFADIDEFPTRLDELPPYSKMKTNKDKLLWVLQFAKGNNIKGLANKDIAWLTDHLGAGVPIGQITASFNSAKSGGYANRSTQDNTIRITEDGAEYLMSVGTQNS